MHWLFVTVAIICISSPTHLVHPGLDAILKMVFEDNFIHADLHPGNVIFQQQGSHDWNLSFIDAGLVAQLQPEDRKNFIDLFAAVVRNDGKRVGELMMERSRGGGVGCRDKEGFARQIGELVNEVHASGLALGKGNTPSQHDNNTPSQHDNNTPSQHDNNTPFQRAMLTKITPSQLLNPSLIHIYRTLFLSRHRRFTPKSAGFVLPP